jgi:hypothetical protein
LVQFSRTFVILTITALFGTGALSAQEAKPVSEKQWKDGRAEWNLYDAMTKASDPKKKLELLNTWKEKYAGTDFKLLRLQAFLATYWTLNQPAQVVATSKEILTIDPKDIRALNSICFLRHGSPTRMRRLLPPVRRRLGACWLIWTSPSQRPVSLRPPVRPTGAKPRVTPK